MGQTNFPNGVNATGLTASGVVLDDATLATAALTASGVTGAVVAEARTFTETAGAGTYTGSIVVPSGAYILDVIFENQALWDNSGTVVLNVGDSDADGYYASVNLKATDLLAGEGLSFFKAGGKEGVYLTATHALSRFASSGPATISAVIVTSSTGGTAGRSRLLVVYVLPTTTSAATKA